MTVAEAQGTIKDVAPEAPSGGLTARFARAPAAHDGETAFKVRVAFSEAVAVGNRAFRDHGVAVSGGRVTKVRKVNGRRDRWEITVKPASLGDVRVTLAGGRACDSPEAVCTPDGRALSNTISTVVRGPVAVSVADARVREAPGATLNFAVTLSRAASGPVTVAYRTADGSARAGSDYTARQGKLRFGPGETAKTVSVPVLDDAHDEGEERLVLRLTKASGARIADGEATGTIENTDHMPAAWIGRFGRTVTGQVLEAVEARLAAPRAAGARARLAGQALPSWDGEGWRGEGSDGRPRYQWRPLSGRAFVTGTSFALTGASEEAGGFVSLWGRGAATRFDGRENALTLDGEVTTGLMGADWAADPGSGSGAGRWRAGLAIGHARGTGSYREDGVCDGERCAGEVEARLTGVWPYAGLELTERLSAWAAAGYGAGELKLTPEDGVDGPFTADLSMTMGAAGIRGEVLTPPSGGGLGFAAPKQGLALDLKARGLVAHEASGFREWGASALLTWDPRPETDRGLALTLRQSWGGSPAGGMDALLGRETLAGVAASPGSGAGASDNGGDTPSAGRLEAELGYGIAMFGGGFTGTPYLGFGLTDGGRDYRLGWRLNPAGRGDRGLALDLEATRREGADADAEHGVMLRATIRW